jgi:hypothetical protein
VPVSFFAVPDGVGDIDDGANGQPDGKANPSAQIELHHKVQVEKYGEAGQPRFQRDLNIEISEKGTNFIKVLLP